MYHLPHKIITAGHWHRSDTNKLSRIVHIMLSSAKHLYFMPWNANACTSIILCTVSPNSTLNTYYTGQTSRDFPSFQLPSTFLLKDTTLSNHLHLASSFFQIFFYLNVDSLLCFGFSVERLSSLLLMLELCTKVIVDACWTGNLIFSAQI